MVSYYRPELGLPEMGLVGRQLWSQSGLKPTDIQTAILYDHFTPFTLIQLEELGFCGQGEAKDFIADGAIEIGGRLPINTHGGQLGEAYIHGMNGIAEGVRQLRGTSVNQVADVEHVLVTAGTGVPDLRPDPGLTQTRTCSSEGTHARVSIPRDAVSIPLARLQTVAPRWVRLRSIRVVHAARLCRGVRSRSLPLRINNLPLRARRCCRGRHADRRRAWPLRCAGRSSAPTNRCYACR